MTEPRSVVITGASRGLGLASATHLYRAGWKVVAAMRSVDSGMEQPPPRDGGRSRRRPPHRRPPRPDRPRLRRRSRHGDRCKRRRTGWIGAQRGDIGGGHGRGDTRRSVGAHVRHQHLRSRGADTGAAAVDARGRPRSYCAGIQSRWGPRHACNRTVLGGQGSARTVG